MFKIIVKFRKNILYIILIILFWIAKDFFKNIPNIQNDSIDYVNIISTALETEDDVFIHKIHAPQEDNMSVITYILKNDTGYYDMGIACFELEEVYDKIGFINVVSGYKPCLNKIILPKHSSILNDSISIHIFDQFEHLNWNYTKSIYILANDSFIFKVECVLDNGDTLTLNYDIYDYIYYIDEKIANHIESINFYNQYNELIVSY